MESFTVKDEKDITFFMDYYFNDDVCYSFHFFENRIFVNLNLGDNEVKTLMLCDDGSFHSYKQDYSDDPINSDVAPEPIPELFITKTQLKCILTDSQISKYLPEADKSFFKYLAKNTWVYRKWNFDKVINIIREHSIPLRFTSRFYENYFFTKNDGYNQKFFIQLKQEIDDKLNNHQLHQ